MASMLDSRTDNAKPYRHTEGTRASAASDALETGISAPEASRRGFLRRTVAATLAGLVTAAGTELVASRPLLAQSTLTPDAALKELMDGNRRFTTGRLLQRVRISTEVPKVNIVSANNVWVPAAGAQGK